MNERIRQLAEQSGINKDAFQFSGTPIKHIVDGPSLEKFAELIIRECAQLADDTPSDYLRQPYKYPSTYIKEYFGVK